MSNKILLACNVITKFDRSTDEYEVEEEDYGGREGKQTILTSSKCLWTTVLVLSVLSAGRFCN